MGQAVARLTDIAKIPDCSHGKPCCSHGAEGPCVGASADVFANGLEVARQGDPGIHSGCCGPNTWNAEGCSSTVFVNGIGVHRLGDLTIHCGGNGEMSTGSPDVIAG